MLTHRLLVLWSPPLLTLLANIDNSQDRRVVSGVIGALSASRGHANRRRGCSMVRVVRFGSYLISGDGPYRPQSNYSPVRLLRGHGPLAATGRHPPPCWRDLPVVTSSCGVYCCYYCVCAAVVLLYTSSVPLFF